MLFKACGIKFDEDLNDEQLLSIDLIGINFCKSSKRRIKEENLPAILKVMPLNKIVFVFKDNPINEIQAIIDKYHPGYIQVYETHLLKYFPTTKKILAINLFFQPQTSILKSLLKQCEYLIFEGHFSGQGLKISEEIDLDLLGVPFILAGGINGSNVHEAFMYKSCIGVDIATGLEENESINYKKVNEIIEKIKTVSLD
jgi:phosphoribosylanthranilate isomerase